ncbi:MAG: hypothetical protein FWC22_08360 [Treponema sp.]|nr:hypothetical protein [Treponema sp.]
MKNTFKLFGIIVLAAVIGFSLISCGEKPESTQQTERATVTYSWSDEGDNYELVITDDSRAITSGNYELKKNGEIIGSGKATIAGSDIKLDNVGSPVTLTVSGGNITIPSSAVIKNPNGSTVELTVGTKPVNKEEHNPLPSGSNSIRVTNEQLYKEVWNEETDTTTYTAINNSGKVYIRFWDDDYEISSKTQIGTINNGKINFNLNVTPPSSELTEAGGGGIPEEGIFYDEGGNYEVTVTHSNVTGEITFNPKDTKGTGAYIFFIDDSTKNEYRLSCYYEGIDTWGGMYYTYVDKNVKISGTMSFTETREFEYYDNPALNETEIRNNSVTYNISFTKGWNVIYQMEKFNQTSSTLSFTSAKPAGMPTLQWSTWFYNEY